MPAIIAGKRKGAKLQVPEGLGVRPTLVRVREALFSMLLSEFGTLEGCHILDPFAGAGLLGLEAWSRGASHVDFIEKERVHFAFLKKNIASLRACDEVQAIQGATPDIWFKLEGRQYDIVLCDPPYAADLMPQTLNALVSRHLLRSSSIVSVELDAADNLEIPAGFDVLKTRKYGKCQIILLTVKPSHA